MNELIGQTLGNYRVEEFIASGGMADVYRGVHVMLERQVAIKVMLPHIAADPGFRARFLQEGKAVASLSHPNIVVVYDFNQQDARFYLVMELVTGGSLHALLRGQGAAPALPLGLDLVRQAAEGLAYAHHRGIVHRDIKPDNLLLKQFGDDDGEHAQRYTVKISDFGLARLAEGGLRTATGLTMGTPAYMSPEQCQGLELDGRSDLYSLGIVLYQVATGALPFEAKSLTEAVYKHVYTDPPPPRSVRPDLPLPLEQVILRCLAKKPADRYQTAGELVRALAEADAPAAAEQAGATVLATLAAPPAIPVPAVAAAAAPIQAPPPPLDPEATVLRTPARGAQPPEPPSLIGSRTAPQVRVLDGRGQVLQTAFLTGNGLTLGRLAGNAVQLEDESLSRHHLRVDWDGERATVTDLGSANGTLLGDIRLLPQVPQRWGAQDWLRAGPFWLRLDLPTGATARADQATRPPAAEHAAAAETDSGRIRVQLDAETLTLTPGQPAALRLTLANLGTTVDHFAVTVEGVPANWVRGPEREVQLNPHAQSPVTLSINVPRAPGSYAGEYPVTIRARSRENPEQSGTAAAVWTVLPFQHSTLALAPQRRGGRLGAAYRLTLENAGNTAARYTLEGKDEEQLLRYRFGQDTVALDPFRSTTVPLRVAGPLRWLGRPEDRRFSILARDGGDQAGEPVRGEFVHKALFPVWITLLPVLLIGIAALLRVLLQPAIESFSYEPLNPVAGQPVIVHWKVQRDTHLELQPINLNLDPHAQGYVFPSGLDRPADLTLVAGNRLGRVQQRMNVAVVAPTATATPVLPTVTPTPIPPTVTPSPEPNAPVIEAWSVTPQQARPGDTVTLTWKVSSADSVEIQPIGTVSLAGTQTYQVQERTTFTLVATNKGKRVTRSIPVLVVTPTPLPTATPTATPIPTATPPPTPLPPTPTPPPAAPGAGAAGAAGAAAGAAGAAAGAAANPQAPLDLGSIAVSHDAAGTLWFWVTSATTGELLRTSPTKGQATLPGGKQPADVVVGDTAAWVADAAAGAVQRFDLQTGQPVGTPIPVGKRPTALAIGKDAAGKESVWVANADDGTVQRIDTQSNSAGPPVTVARGLTAIADGKDAVWVTVGADNSVRRLPLQNGQPSGPPIRIAAGKNPDALVIERDAAGKESIWVANADDASVQRLDPTNNTTSAPIAVGKKPAALAVGKDAAGKDVLLVANAADGTVLRLDPQTNTAGPPLATDDTPGSIAFEQGHFWVLSRTQGTIKEVAP